MQVPITRPSHVGFAYRFAAKLQGGKVKPGLTVCVCVFGQNDAEGKRIPAACLPACMQAYAQFLPETYSNLNQKGKDAFTSELE